MAYSDACDNLKINAPNFVVNGITGTECDSLKVNTGLNPNANPARDNCQDLNDMLDCLVGAQQEKLIAVDLCDLKDYFDEVMRNLYNLNKAIICSTCGLWDTQTGTNANGTYIKFPDGTMICYYSSILYTINDTPVGTGWRMNAAFEIWTYPAAFIAKPHIEATSTNFASASFENPNSVFCYYSLTSFDINRKAYVNIMAIGRWK